MGSIYSRLGTEVTVLEFFDKVLMGMDHDISKNFKSILQRQGFKFHLNCSVSMIAKEKKGVKVTFEQVECKDQNELSADVVLVATGRKPFTKNLKLENIGVELNSRGQVETDSYWRTSTKNVFAIGDVIPGPMLAHKAEEDGIAAVEIMNGVAGHVNYDLVPGIVYTSPEVATLGKTEDELKECQINYNKGVFPFSANSRARAINHTDGFVKILSDKNSDKVLGVHIIGHEAGNLVHEVATAMSFGGSAEDIARTCHGHPTLNEAVKEAALAAGTGAIHI
jgi:dihydrolipoamide dehydrogenase